jgi:hypothetical protein
VVSFTPRPLYARYKFDRWLGEARETVWTRWRRKKKPCLCREPNPGLARVDQLLPQPGKILLRDRTVTQQDFLTSLLWAAQGRVQQSSCVLAFTNDGKSPPLIVRFCHRGTPFHGTGNDADEPVPANLASNTPGCGSHLFITSPRKSKRTRSNGQNLFPPRNRQREWDKCHLDVHVEKISGNVRRPQMLLNEHSLYKNTNKRTVQHP